MFANVSLLCVVGHYQCPPGSTTSVLLVNSRLINTAKSTLLMAPTKI